MTKVKTAILKENKQSLTKITSKTEQDNKEDILNTKESSDQLSNITNKVNTGISYSKSRKKSRFFETHISRLLGVMSADNGITLNAKQQLNSILCIICDIIACKSINLTEFAKKKTISEKEVSNAIKIVLAEFITLEMLEDCNEVIKAYNTQKKNANTVKNTSRQEKVGIIFPPSQMEKFLRRFDYTKIMLTMGAPILLAYVVERLTKEILGKAIITTNNNKRNRITIRDLELAVRNDHILNSIFIHNNLFFTGGGVVPFIHPSLLVKRIRKKVVNRDEKKNEEKTDVKKHRFRPGTVAIREIRSLQKSSDCVTFAKIPFERCVRKIISEKCKLPIKISKDAFLVLQYFIEQKMISLLRQANFASIHAGRLKLIPADIEFILAILNNTEVYQPDRENKTT